MNRKSFIEGIIKKNKIELIQKDNIDISQKGFTLRHHSKSICIYYVFEESIVVIEGELSGIPEYDFLIYAEYRHLEYSYNPLTNTFQELSFADKQKIQLSIIQWLSQKRIRNDAVAGF